MRMEMELKRIQIGFLHGLRKRPKMDICMPFIIWVDTINKFFRGE